MPTVIETADRFRGQLARLETSATSDLLSAYQGVSRRLEDKIAVLTARFEQLEKRGALTPENVRKLGTWGSLLNQIEDEITKYGGYVDTQNRVAAQKSIDLAGKHSQLLTATYFNDNPSLLKAFNASWDRLPNESVENLLGFLQQDSTLSQNLNRTLGTAAAQNFADKLIEGISLGYNPNKINSLINQTLAEPLTWSLNTIRTTQNYAYRESTRANYVNNEEILGGWKWYAALDGRVCLSCVNQHGRDFPLNARLNDHHQGRCTQIPILDRPERFGLKPVKIEQGEKWFNKLPQADQVNRMGQERHAAYKSGKFKFKDLSEVYQNDTFGEMLKEASLKSLLSKPKSKPKPKPTEPKQPKATLESVVGLNKVVDKVVNKLESGLQKAKDLFKVSKYLSKDTQLDLTDGITLIDKVHGFGSGVKPTRIDELANLNKGTLGLYYPSSRGIEILDRVPEAKTVIIHEIGHFIDFELGNGRSATKSQEFKEWRKAVENSKAFNELVDRLADPDKFAITIGNERIKPEIAYTDYLLKYEELFARSYAQYILTKTGQGDLYDEARQDLLYGSMQWQDKDFKPIEQALDKLFEGLQWKK